MFMILNQPLEPKFPIGKVAVTPHALEVVTLEELISGLRRHSEGDWGNVDPDDAVMNDEALKHGNRILSVYGKGKHRFWIITEADRAVTTILMPDDY